MIKRSFLLALLFCLAVSYVFAISPTTQEYLKTRVMKIEMPESGKYRITLYVVNGGEEFQNKVLRVLYVAKANQSIVFKRGQSLVVQAKPVEGEGYAYRIVDQMGVPELVWVFVAGALIGAGLMLGVGGILMVVGRKT